ncbi:MAG: recombinase family protein [Actinobacteria bacterium]|nr:recombinase family protein [Actinomycetota bacterium]
MYCRISKDRVGAGLGIERQRQDCEELAAKLGWTIVSLRTDNDLSAYSGKPRPGYQALLDDLRSGRVSAVLAWHTDRLHRSPVELEEYIAVSELHGAPTHCVKAGQLDLSTPSGRLVARQLGAVARYEVEHMIERQKSAKAQAAAAGKYRGGRRAFGYEADGMTIRESEAEIIREMAARVLVGESLRSLAAELNERGITGTRGGLWTGAALRDVLVKARVGGMIEHNGQIVGPALWPPVLPVDQWRAVRAYLTAPGRSHGKSAARTWLLSGLALCGLEGCGLPVRITSHRTSNGKAQRSSYRCSGRAVHVSRSADHVDDLVTDTVIERLSRPDATRLLRPKTPLVDITALHTEANAIRARMDELASLYAKGAVNASQLATGTEELEAAVKAVDARIAAATSSSPLAGLAGEPDVAAKWPGLSLDRKRAVVDMLVTVTILPGKRGRKAGGIYFDPETVRITWRGAAA